MVIQFRCTCGQVLGMSEEYAGRTVRCAACGQALRVPEGRTVTPAPRGAPVSASPYPPPAQGASGIQPVPSPTIAAPPGVYLAVPTEVPPKFRAPGLPPCWLDLSAEGVAINANFDTTPLLSAFVEGFAKALRKRYDVRMGPPPPGAMPSRPGSASSTQSGKS